MDQFTNKIDDITAGDDRMEVKATRGLMNPLIETLIKFGILKEDLDYHLLGASMVIIFAFFGYQKWFAYKAKALIPFISNGPVIFWLYPVFGIRGATWFLGVSEWTFGVLLFLGFWNKYLGILGAIGSCITFIGTVTIIPLWLGYVCRRLSSYDRKRCFSDERYRSLFCISLFAETGCIEGVAFRQARARSQCGGIVPLGVQRG